MGAGQIGGIASLMDIDFNNAAGFIGDKPDFTDGQHIVMFMSHSMMFCTGSLIEAHVVLTAAMCIMGEKFKFDIVAGTHRFLENTGIIRQADHICLHRGYNYSSTKYEDCTGDNVGLIIVNSPFQFNQKYKGADFVLNRVRYGAGTVEDLYDNSDCRYFGWGSRRNNFLIPLLIHVRRVKVVIIPKEKCLQLFNYGEKYLCVQQHQCISETYGALCPDDIGAVIECSGFARGMMVSRLVDRPCGVGFIDLSHFQKFLTCGVDDSRDVIYHDFPQTVEIPTMPPTPELLTLQESELTVTPAVEPPPTAASEGDSEPPETKTDATGEPESEPQPHPEPEPEAEPDAETETTPEPEAETEATPEPPAERLGSWRG